MSAADATRPIIELRGIVKTFGALRASDGVDFTVQPGEVHALLGENGAGKSTLTRILYGLSRPDEGEILVDGVPVTMSRPAEAIAAGIGLVTQEFSLVGPMSVAENLMLAGIGLGRVDRRAGRERTRTVAARLGVEIDPDASVETLSVGERQRVEILKALANDCRVLILDEPTAVLLPADVERLFESIRRLTATGMGVVFISHKLHEVVEIADRVSILRHGRIVTTRPAAGLDPAAIAALMVGADTARDPEAAAPLGAAVAAGTARRADRTPAPAGAVAALEIRGLSAERDGVRVLDGVDLTVPPGTIVGIAGVSGNGQTELVEALSGLREVTAGSVRVAGDDVTDADVEQRLARGLGRLSEDRRGSVMLPMTVEHNLVIEDLDRFRRGPFLDRRRIRAHARRLIDEFAIKAAPGDAIRSLSGGNMQKVLLARAISRAPKALVVSQPTRGLDVASCEYVYRQLDRLMQQGCGVLFISEDLDELLAQTDRIEVMLDGRIVGGLATADADRASLGVMMTSGMAA